MTKLLLLISGGAIGTVLRYAIGGFSHKLLDANYPIGTLVVNLSGSFIIGILWSIWEQNDISPNIRTFLFIGLLGGYTTFSSFALETLNLFRDGDVRMAIFNILANNVLGIGLVFLGYFLARWILSIIKI
jgi:CrcB protein